MVGGVCGDVPEVQHAALGGLRKRWVGGAGLATLRGSFRKGCVRFGAQWPIRFIYSKVATHSPPPPPTTQFVFICFGFRPGDGVATGWAVVARQGGGRVCRAVASEGRGWRETGRRGEV